MAIVFSDHQNARLRLAHPRSCSVFSVSQEQRCLLVKERHSGVWSIIYTNVRQDKRISGTSLRFGQTWAAGAQHIRIGEKNTYEPCSLWYTQSF